ncbi:MAG: ATPase, partial [Actinobacteria bacterium]|nr:ATPase [Actinomycetota bacterium]
EEHGGRIAHLTTLAGYVHEQLTGTEVLGVGDASGMFPIDLATGSYNETMLAQFDELVAGHGFGWTLGGILPTVLSAGEEAGRLTAAGAALLDPSGTLQPGVLCCPPEGDAGTGMVATNSVARRTGNVSAGTSIFAMVVLEHDLSRMHPELDLVTTPAGDLVAMVHCNNGASELNAWAGLFAEFAGRIGATVDTGTVFESLFTASLEGEHVCGGLLAYNYLSGEHITRLEEGRPLFVRTPDSRFTLANFMRTHLFAALSSLRIGMNVLLKTENVALDSLFAHGGLFKTKGVAQRYLAAAVDAPVSVGDIAGEGGAWGIAVLAAFARDRAEGESLADYLNARVFAGAGLETVEPDPADVAGFDAYVQRFSAGLAIERAAVEHS